jgi:hypothetical protein
VLTSLLNPTFCIKPATSIIMKNFLLIITILFSNSLLFAQKVDSICFRLYTDSLKKGNHNYINVDGKFSDGKWLPLTDKEIQFSSSHGNFIHNDLVLPIDFAEEKITVKAVLKNNPAIWKEKIIWIKTLADPLNLPTMENIMNGNQPRKNKRKNRNN